MSPFVFLLALAHLSCPCQDTEEVQLTLSLSAMLQEFDGESHSFLFRTLQYREADELTAPALIRDGVLTLRYGRHYLQIEQTYDEQRQEDAYREVHRHRTLFLDALTGESATSTLRFDNSETTVYLEYWTRIPSIFFHALGLLSPAETSLDSLPTSTKEHVLRDSDLPLETATRVENQLVQGSVVRTIEGDVLGTLRFESFGHVDGCSRDVPFQILEVQRYPSGSLRNAGMYRRVRLTRSSGDNQDVPPGSGVLDMRQRGKEVTSVPTDRAMALSDILAWYPVLPTPLAIATTSTLPKAGMSEWTFPGLSRSLLSGAALAGLTWMLRRRKGRALLQ